jgi:hypothetical protein
VDSASQPVLSTPWIIAIAAFASSSATAIMSMGLQRIRRSRRAKRLCRIGQSSTMPRKFMVCSM